MNVIPAQVAGVPRIVMVSPPGPSGLPDKLVMATAAMMGLEEIYAVGGAQSIGALAYGTESIQQVVKITGPYGGKKRHAHCQKRTGDYRSKESYT